MDAATLRATQAPIKERKNGLKVSISMHRVQG